MKIFSRKEPIKKEDLKDWQIELLNNEYVYNVDEFIEKYAYNSNFEDEYQFKRMLEFYTRFSSSEQCDFTLSDVFEDFHYVDIDNADYLSHYIIYDDGDYLLFENKCGRAYYSVYRFEWNPDIIEFDEKKDKYAIIGEHREARKLLRDNYIFPIRLKDVEFTHQFLENLLQRSVKFKKRYITELNRSKKLNGIIGD